MEAVGEAAARGAYRGRRSSSAASPSSGSRASPRGGSVSGRSAEAEENEEDDDELMEQLEELEELTNRLNLGAEDAGALELRPATGGTSASASTTARGGSSVGCTTSEDEPSSEVGAEGANTFSATTASEEDGEAGRSDWCGAVLAAYEVQQLRLPHGCRIERSPGASGQFFFTIDVAEGPFTPATLTFWIKIFDEFPSPGSCSVRCTQRIFHPSVNATTGRIAIPDELYEGGEKTLLALLTFVRQLILTPADSSAANSDAALLLQTDPEEFRRTVRFTLNGGQHGGVQYDSVLHVGKAASKAAATGEPQQAPLTDAVKLGVMRLEVMRDQMKSKASELQRRNSAQIAILS